MLYRRPDLWCERPCTLIRRPFAWISAQLFVLQYEYLAPAWAYSCHDQRTLNAIILGYASESPAKLLCG